MTIDSDRKQASDYAIAFDFLAKITHSEKEEEVIESILLLFDMLFTPQVLRYHGISESTLDKITSLKVGEFEENGAIDSFSKSADNYDWTPSGNGFLAKIARQGVVFGILEVDHLTFSENKEQYLNLVLSVADVCALAIENSRRIGRLIDVEKNLRLEKERLEKALAEVKTLSGLLPICSYCKNIRDDSGYWKKIEVYIREHADVDFSHSICQVCAKKHHPDLDLYTE